MKQKMMKFLTLGFVALLLSACSEGGDNGDGNSQQATAETMSGKEDTDKEPEILYWVAPMDPNYRRDEPGKSPMGMDLIPMYADGEDASGQDGPVVRIDPVVVNNMGVRLTPVERGRLGRRIDTVGYVDFDEAKVVHIHLRTEGWIEKLYVKSEGERVKKGDILFTLYSPTLVNAQEEFLQAIRSGNKILVKASRERLLALGLSTSQVTKLRNTREVKQNIGTYAPQDGIVTNLTVRQGMFVRPTNEIMSLADLSSIWLLAEVFEQQVDWLNVGDPADMRLSFLPGREWEGTVEYIYPSLDAKTRTLKVRLLFENPNEDLKPNMYANVRLYGGFKEDILFVPREALIRTAAEARVIISLGEGRFTPRIIKAGIESGNFVEIMEGLKEGERVVISGQFLIDSEASLKASMLRMAEPAANVSMNEPQAEPDAGKQVSGRGTVTNVMVDHNMLTLNHEPINELGWPSMTMDFTVTEEISLSDLSTGDAIEFDLEKRGERYLITAIRARE